MKIKNFLKVACMTVLMAIFLCGCSDTQDIVVVEDSAPNAETNSAADESGYKVYLITMDLADDFWKSIDQGCRKAVAEFGGVNYEWIGPDINEDAPQMECIDRAVAEGAQAIVLAASSPRGVNPALEKAAAAGVKIIYVDNAAEFDCVAFLATNNELAGQIAGETMLKALAEANISSGTIGLMVNKANVTSTARRVAGFRKAFEGTDFKLDDTFFMEDEPQRIKNFVAEHPEYVAFFGSNERTIRALGEQMRDSGARQLLVGFDTSDDVLAMINDGIVYATLRQKPQLMGYDGIRIARETLMGSYTEKNAVIDTGVEVIYKNSI